MIQAQAILLYEKLLPGSQLVNRLQDLRYRVHTLSNPTELVAAAERLTPLFVLVDLEPKVQPVLAAVKALRSAPSTSHLPIIGFAKESGEWFALATQHKEFTLLVSDTAIVAHLPQILDQALDIK